MMYLLKMKLITSTRMTGVIATANDGSPPAGANACDAEVSGPSAPKPSPAPCARRARIMSQRLPKANIMTPAMIPAGRSECIGVEVRHRDGILDRRGTGKRRHGKSEGTECDGRGNKALWQVALTEHLDGDWEHGEGDDKQRNAP